MRQARRSSRLLGFGEGAGVWLFEIKKPRTRPRSCSTCPTSCRAPSFNWLWCAACNVQCVMIIGDMLLGLMLLCVCLLCFTLFCSLHCSLPWICLPCTLIDCLVLVCDRTLATNLLFCLVYNSGSVKSLFCFENLMSCYRKYILIE